MTTEVRVKWGKESYVVEIEGFEGVDDFKMKLFSLTGVPVDRMKVMGFKGGPLKSSSTKTWKQLGLKPSLKVMLIGTAGDVKAPDAATVKKLQEEAVRGGGGKKQVLPTPIGLNNLGNTCYMNSTLQCLRVAEGLEAKLTGGAVGDAGGADSQLTRAAGQLFGSLRQAQGPVPPFQFLSTLHSSYPQFAEKGPQGGLMQHDAQECWSSMMDSFKRTNPELSDLFKFKVQSTAVCVEAPDVEAPQVKLEDEYMLRCPIDSSTNYLLHGLESNLEGSVEKRSEALDRNAIWTKKTLLHALPSNLAIQFLRFYWRQDLNKGAGGKTKISRPVQYPLKLDVYTLCSDELKASLTEGRKAYSEQQDAEALGETAAEPGQRQTGFFELKAVLTHKGRSSDGGHYVAYTKCDIEEEEEEEEPLNKRPKAGGAKKQPLPENALWIKYDDDKPSYVRASDVLLLSGKGGADHFIAYILLYKAILA